ncbi:hypothetical protein MRB53_035929 [Persea americana]|uniref:Uncharacterized protein n=1 Tax=Persea americana TaxID=3435 RepID=A0ACC2K617_PERAE|nr:hypothetical protein MRB53_035929 [Persea americana]
MAATTSLSCVFLAAFFLLLSHLHPATAARQVTITQFLNPQNEVRARHGLPLLKWDFKLAKFAKWYANQRRSDCALIHSSGDLGENIFWGKGRQ